MPSASSTVVSTLLPPGCRRKPSKSCGIRPSRTKNGNQSLAQSLAHQGGEFRAQHYAEAVVLNVKAHDVLGLRPEVFADGADARAHGTTLAARLLRTAGATQHDAGCSVAEQRCGDKHREAWIVDAQAKRA